MGQKVKFVNHNRPPQKENISNVKNYSVNVSSIEQRYKSVHIDVFVRPTIKGSKVKEGQILKIVQTMSCLYSN